MRAWPALLLFPLALAGPSAWSQPERTPAGPACNFDAWSADRDPAGLNVRAGPSSSARIVGKLPPRWYDPDTERHFAPGFTVVEARNGWFRIVDPMPWGAPGVRGPLPSGWISGRHIDFELQTRKAFAAPDPRSAVVAVERRDDGRFPFPYRHPSDCRGEWVKLKVTPAGGPEREGWVRGVCGNQDTSCDGVWGD